MREVIENQILSEINKKSHGKKIILFGASMTGFKTIVRFPELEISYFCDNDAKKWGSIHCGIPVYSPEKLLQENPNDIFVIISSTHFKEIANLLKKNGIEGFSILRQVDIDKISKNPDKINKVIDMLYDNESKRIFSEVIKKRTEGDHCYLDLCVKPQYFIKEFFESYMSTDEIYVDAGLYSASTIQQFTHFVNNQYEKIYGFEPNPESFDRSINGLPENSEKIKLLPFALFDSKKSLSFSPNEGGNAKLDLQGDIIVQAVPLDEIIEGRVSFIKMDIEGAEIEALLGARQKIEMYKPKLAICLYHKTEHLWEIPMLLKEFVPEYKFFVRHHSERIYETVLYARI